MIKEINNIDKNLNENYLFPQKYNILNKKSEQKKIQFYYMNLIKLQNEHTDITIKNKDLLKTIIQFNEDIKYFVEKSHIPAENQHRFSEILYSGIENGVEEINSLNMSIKEKISSKLSFVTCIICRFVSKILLYFAFNILTGN